MNARPVRLSIATVAAPTSGDSALLRESMGVQRHPTWRERELAMPWPDQLINSFAMRMAAHGMCVSKALMTYDRRYAMQQLKDAHNLADDNLRLMAVQLFRHFESRQSGIDPVH